MSRAALDWPTVPGVVLDSRLDRDDEGDYLPHVRYQYEVDGTTHTSDSPLRPSFTFKSGDNFGLASDLVRRFPVDSTVRVHVHPDDPTTSALATQPASAYRILLFLALFPLVGAGILLFTWRSPFRRNGLLRPSWDRLARRQQLGLGAIAFFSFFLAFGLVALLT